MALPLVACHGALLGVWDLGAAPILSVSLLLLTFAAHLVLLPRLDASRDVVALLGVAAILRLLLLPLPPTLSDDIVRYVWDGRVAASGFDPYRLAPEDPRLAPLRDEAWRTMPHKEVQTVYPPVALGTFTLASSTPAPRLVLKSILAAADWIACALLIGLAVRLGHAPGRAAAYAWSPLPCLEIAGMGHVDALVVLFSVVAVSLLARRPSTARFAGFAGFAGAAAVASKLVPLVALPFWALHARARRGVLSFAVAAVLATAVLLAPMVVPSSGPPPGLVTFGVSWEWNGPLYEPLWRGLDRAEAAPAIHRALDRQKERTGRHEELNRVYPFVYPQLLAKAILALGLGVALLALFGRRLVHRHGRPGRAEELIADTGRLFTILLLAMATVYPWYLLWVLPWAGLARHRAWLAAAGTSVIAYLPQHVDGLELFPWIWIAVWGPFFVLWPVSRWCEQEADR